MKFSNLANSLQIHLNRNIMKLLNTSQNGAINKQNNNEI